MDLTRPVTYRGLLLTGAEGGPGGAQPIVGIRLSRARFTDVPAVGYTEKRSLDEGLDASDVYLGGRTMQLTGEVFGGSKAALFDRLDQMRDVFTASSAFRAAPGRQGFLPLSFSQPTLLTGHHPDGFIERVLFCRPQTQNEHDVVFGAIGGASTQGYVVPFTVALQAKDPLFYAPVDKSVLVTGSGSANFVNRGNVPAPVRVELYMETTAARTFTLDDDRTTLTIDVPAGDAGRIVIVTTKQRIATLDGHLQMDMLDISHDWPVVVPTPQGEAGDPHSWTTGGAGYGALSSISWPELWS